MDVTTPNEVSTLGEFLYPVEFLSKYTESPEFANLGEFLYPNDYGTNELHDSTQIEEGSHLQNKEKSSVILSKTVSIN